MNERQIYYPPHFSKFLHKIVIPGITDNFCKAPFRPTFVSIDHKKKQKGQKREKIVLWERKSLGNVFLLIGTLKGSACALTFLPLRRLVTHGETTLGKKKPKQAQGVPENTVFGIKTADLGQKMRKINKTDYEKDLSFVPVRR